MQYLCVHTHRDKMTGYLMTCLWWNEMLFLSWCEAKRMQMERMDWIREVKKVSYNLKYVFL